MKNRYEKRGDHYAIFANGGGMQHEILVDEADFETVAAFLGTWGGKKSGNTWYALIRVRGVDGKWKNMRMHRVLLNPPKDLEIDHRNHNGLDNRRKNIRIVTKGENMRNRIDNVERQSNVDGVTRAAINDKWQAKWRGQYLGEYTQEEDAIRAVLEYRATGKIPDRIRIPAVRQSGEPGVSWHSPHSKWQARWKEQALGEYKREEDAIKAVRDYRKTGKIPNDIRRRTVGLPNPVLDTTESIDNRNNQQYSVVEVMTLSSTAEILFEYEEERNRLLLKPPSKFRDSLLRNLDDAIAVLRGEPLPERSHKGKAMAADWLDRLADSRDTVARIEDAEFHDPRLKRLTPRQLEIMQMVADGLSYSEIGDMLGISRYTVSTIVRRRRRKAVRT